MSQPPQSNQTWADKTLTNLDDLVAANNAKLGKIVDLLKGYIQQRAEEAYNATRGDRAAVVGALTASNMNPVPPPVNTYQYEEITDDRDGVRYKVREMQLWTGFAVIPANTPLSMQAPFVDVQLPFDCALIGVHVAGLSANSENGRVIVTRNFREHPIGTAAFVLGGTTTTTGLSAPLGTVLYIDRHGNPILFRSALDHFTIFAFNSTGAPETLGLYLDLALLSKVG